MGPLRSPLLTSTLVDSVSMTKEDNKDLNSDERKEPKDRFICRTDVVTHGGQDGFYVVDVMVYNTEPLPDLLRYVRPDENFVGFFGFNDKSVNWTCNLITRLPCTTIPNAVDDYLAAHFGAIKKAAEEAFRNGHARETFPGPDTFVWRDPSDS